MKSASEIIAGAIKSKAHSFEFLRRTTELTLSDEQFHEVVAGEPDRFRPVLLVKRDLLGKPISPGRPGVKLRAGKSD